MPVPYNKAHVYTCFETGVCDILGSVAFQETVDDVSPTGYPHRISQEKHKRQCMNRLIVLFSIISPLFAVQVAAGVHVDGRIA